MRDADVLQDMPRAEAEEVLAQVDQVTRLSWRS